MRCSRYRQPYCLGERDFQGHQAKSSLEREYQNGQTQQSAQMQTPPVAGTCATYYTVKPFCLGWDEGFEDF